MKANKHAQVRQALRRTLDADELIIWPGIFDGISAKVAESAGFQALYMTGYGVAASYLGLPDAGIATYTDMVNRVAQLAKTTALPLIADADTGYGGLLNVMHTVAGYEAAGAAAIQIEDQEFPKRCGHMLGRRVIPTQDMVAKIRVAVDTRSDPNFLIVARTDSLTSLGVDEAMRRAEQYAMAGADILFIEGPESIEEMARIGAAFDLPLISSVVKGGRTPVLTTKELAQLGYKIALFPTLGFLAASKAMEIGFKSLLAGTSSDDFNVPLYDFKAFSSLMGFDQVTALDDKYGEKND
ncbi:MAG: isocitrate lyase/PEP mutase family protein [Pseudomonadota bacterium]